MTGVEVFAKLAATFRNLFITHLSLGGTNEADAHD